MQKEAELSKSSASAKASQGVNQTNLTWLNSFANA